MKTKQAMHSERKPIVKQIAEIAKQIQLKRDAEELDKLVVAAGEGKKGAAKAKAEATIKVAGLKKIRLYPPKIELPDHVTLEDIKAFMPKGCKVNHCRTESAWRLNAYGQEYSRAFAKWPPEGAGVDIIKIAWTRALELGFQTESPFDNFAWIA